MLFDKKSGWKVDVSIQYENILKAINCMNLLLHVFPDAVITKHSVSSVRDGDDELSPAALSRIALISTTNACYGTSEPRGPLTVMIRHLKILGYDCVLVRLARFSFFTNTQFTEMWSYLLFCRSWIGSYSPCLSKTRQTFWGAGFSQNPTGETNLSQSNMRTVKWTQKKNVSVALNCQRTVLIACTET